MKCDGGRTRQVSGTTQPHLSVCRCGVIGLPDEYVDFHRALRWSSTKGDITETEGRFSAMRGIDFAGFWAEIAGPFRPTPVVGKRRPSA